MGGHGDASSTVVEMPNKERKSDYDSREIRMGGEQCGSVGSGKARAQCFGIKTESGAMRGADWLGDAKLHSQTCYMMAISD